MGFNRDKSHIYTIFSIIVFLLVIAFLVQRLLIPQSFGEHGHYRWDAVNQIMAQKVVNQNVNVCSKCHKNIYELHEKDAHYNVPCVDCHGSADKHVAFHDGGDGAKGITKDQAILEKKFNFEGCLFCHRKLKARPNDFPQIGRNAHYSFLHITDSTTKCIQCHSPHEPIFLLTDVKNSRLHPVVYRCTDCHEKKPAGNWNGIKNHPVIFECKYCHADVVKSFESKPHSKYIECRTCHLFHGENETAGRIYKNGNARFCLLCHENKPFKDAKYPPKINWPDHLGNFKDQLNINQKICLNCHQDKIHIMNLKSNPNPHQANWLSVHKNFAKPAANGKVACNDCHKKDFCFACHKVEIPHPSNWEEKHKEIVAKQGKQVCSKCHKPDFCTKCHEID